MSGRVGASAFPTGEAGNGRFFEDAPVEGLCQNTVPLERDVFSTQPSARGGCEERTEESDPAGFGTGASGRVRLFSPVEGFVQ